MKTANTIGIPVSGLQGNNVLVKITGIKNKSGNLKTGAMVQSYLLPQSWIDARYMGDDKEICGDCPHTQGNNKDCYVRKGSSVMGLISTMKGRIDMMVMPSGINEILPLLERKSFRFGSYGDPVLMGEKVVRAISGVVKNHTGYTHQWRDERFQWAAKYFMASVESESEMAEANAMGWRTFRVRQADEELTKSEVSCPASKEMGKRVTCADCGLCKGNSIKAKNINIIKH